MIAEKGCVALAALTDATVPTKVGAPVAPSTPATAKRTRKTSNHHSPSARLPNLAPLPTTTPASARLCALSSGVYVPLRAGN